MCLCAKCSKITGVLVGVAGILFLLQDLAIWSFFGLNWYTVAFLLVGLTGVASSTCKACHPAAKK